MGNVIMQLGRKIRDLRLRRGLTVQKLADATGLSKGFISQVENDRTSPSLASLRGLAAALRTSMAYLVVEDDPTPHVVRVAKRPQLPAAANISRAELLSALPRRNLELLMLELPPGRLAGEQRHSNPGEECLLCVEGRVRLLHGEQEWMIETGDSCHFDGRIPHSIENLDPAAARVLIAMMPAAFEPVPRMDEPQAAPEGEPLETSTSG
jgi:transcriptional regulator with XRE-family HTH domain